MADVRAAVPQRASGEVRTSAVRRILGRDWWLGWLLVGPVLLIVLALLIYPFIDAILLSFKNQLIGKAGTWVGFQNYTDLFTKPDSKFVSAAWNTVAITGAAIIGKLIIGMAMACVLNQRIQLRNLWRGLMFLPWCVPAVVTAYAWRFLFDTTGPINGMIAEYGWRSEYIYFFNDAKIALPALVLVIIWSGTPFWTMNLLAGMQAISSELYEAAEIDGASTLQRFRYITIPGLMPVITVTALLSTIWTSANLTQILVLTGGGPNYATMTLPLLSYFVAIPGHELGMGSAISIMMMPAYLILVYFLTRRMLRQE
ncbi:MAG: sugar ABC transporter permease [Chloroflexia bacterium]